jgi:hypothetical protein
MTVSLSEQPNEFHVFCKAVDEVLYQRATELLFTYPSHLGSNGEAIVKGHHPFQGIEPEDEQCRQRDSAHSCIVLRSSSGAKRLRSVVAIDRICRSCCFLTADNRVQEPQLHRTHPVPGFYIPQKKGTMRGNPNRNFILINRHGDAGARYSVCDAISVNLRARVRELDRLGLGPTAQECDDPAKLWGGFGKTPTFVP